MKILSFLSRYRLLINILALALALGALAAAPAAADIGGSWTCSTDCVDWDVRNGCVRSMECCTNPDGRWYCHYVA